MATALARKASKDKRIISVQSREGDGSPPLSMLNKPKASSLEVLIVEKNSESVSRIIFVPACTSFFKEAKAASRIFEWDGPGKGPKISS